MAELVYARVLEARPVRVVGSSPTHGTKNNLGFFLNYFMPLGLEPGKGENGSFLYLRKVHENPKVFVRVPTKSG